MLRVAHGSQCHIYTALEHTINKCAFINVRRLIAGNQYPDFVIASNIQSRPRYRTVAAAAPVYNSIAKAWRRTSAAGSRAGSGGL